MIIDSPIISGSSAASGSLNQFGNVAITGSLTVTGAIIGAVTGSVDSASYSSNATSASYATNASAANTAVTSSYPLAVTGNIVYTPLGGTNPSTFATGGSQNTIILGYQAGLNTTGSSNEGEGSMYVGAYAGKDSYNNYSTIFIGEGAGERSTFNAFSTTIGAYAGYLSTASYESVVVGYNAGFRNENSYFTTIVGEDAGYRIKASHGATILGNGAGSTILSSSYSTIVGYSAGPYIENSKGGIFIGPWSGEYSMSGSYSIVIGNSSGRLRNFSGNRTLGTNNIIIGTNIALTPGTNNGINIGGLIFGSGSAYQSMKSDGSGYDGSASSFSGSANGRIGINQPNPQYSLDVSGSGNFTNGLTVTGSIVGALTGTASYASNANLLDGLDSTQFTLTSSFSAYTASLNNFSASILSYTSSNNDNIAALYAATASLYNATASIYGATSSLFNYSASSNLRINALDQYTASLNTRSASFACVTATNNFACAQYFSNASNAVSFTSTGSLYSDGGVRITKDMYVSGTAFFNNVTVFGTQSVNYITSSQLNISSNIISVNTATPTVRFGGLAVYDSGSLGTGLTGSLLWDSEDNQWIYSNPSGSAYDSALFLVGPRNSGALGGEAGITCNFLSKGNGMHHMTSSGIFEDGSRTCFYGNTVIGSGGTVCTTMTNTSCLGVGTTTPSSRVEVLNPAGDTRITVTSTTSTGASDIMLKNSGGTVAYEWLVQGLGADGRFRIFDNCGASTGERFTILQDGNIGIGCATPGASLDINSGAALSLNVNSSQNTYLRFQKSGTSFGDIGNAESLATGGNACDFAVHARSTGNIVFATNFTERARITNAGVACFVGTVCAPTFVGNTTGNLTGNVSGATYVCGTTLSATSEYRLNGNSYSRVATLDSGGGFGGGYNFNWCNGSPIHDSTGALVGYGYANDGSFRFYTNSSAAAGTAAPEKLRINASGIASFTCTVCAPTVSSVKGLFSGCVGINNPTPAWALDICGSIYTRTAYQGGTLLNIAGCYGIIVPAAYLPNPGAIGHILATTEGSTANMALLSIDDGSGGAQGFAIATGDNTSISPRMCIASSGITTFACTVCAPVFAPSNGIIGNNSNNLYLSSNSTAGEISFWGNQLNTRLMTILGNGCVSIGACSAPGAQLVVYGACNGDTTLHVQSGTVSGKISFSNNTANTIYGGGWWGYMGYSSATYHYFGQCVVAPKLEILRSSANNGLFVYSNSGATPIGCTMAQINGLTNDSTGNILTLASLNDGIRMVVRNDGNVGIGNNSPAYKLDVVGNSRVCGSLLVSSTTDGYTNGRLHVSRYGNSSGGSILMGLENDSTGKWSYLVSTQYNSSTYPQGFSVIGGYTDSTANKVVIGGSIYEANPATEIQFWTHTSVSHNLGGSQKMTITCTGVVNFACTICVNGGNIFLPGSISGRTAQIEFGNSSTADILGMPNQTSTFYLKYGACSILFTNDAGGEILRMCCNRTIAVNGPIVPTSNGTIDLGTSSLRWCTVYTSDLSLSNGIGDYTIVEGENDLFLYNNNSCKVFKFLLQEVCPEIAPAKRSI